jgi:hypothetical protein
MEPATFRRSILLIGSFWCVFIGGAVYFVGAYFIQGLTNDTPTQFNNDFFTELIFLLVGLLLIISMIISWFKTKLGGYLITSLAIFGTVFYLDGFIWIPAPMIFIGMLLLVDFYNKSKA